MSQNSPGSICWTAALSGLYRDLRPSDELGEGQADDGLGGSADMPGCTVVPQEGESNAFLSLNFRFVLTPPWSSAMLGSGPASGSGCSWLEHPAAVSVVPFR